MVVLLAEDDIGIQFFIWNLLKHDGFTVLTASDGRAALETARNHSGPIDLLLTDLEMPHINGLELSKVISIERPEIKILTMSGYLPSSPFASVNDWAFIPKPFTSLALRKSIQAVLSEPALRDSFKVSPPSVASGDLSFSEYSQYSEI
jgi:two-component system, cell cycle sensor histidine kinase and response regulator CckA